MASSSSGIPQHWHISFIVSLSRVFINTSNSFESSFNVSVFGTVSPFSQRDTAFPCQQDHLATLPFSCEILIIMFFVSFIFIMFTSVRGIITDCGGSRNQRGVAGWNDSSGTPYFLQFSTFHTNSRMVFIFFYPFATIQKFSNSAFVLRLESLMLLYFLRVSQSLLLLLIFSFILKVAMIK